MSPTIVKIGGAVAGMLPPLAPKAVVVHGAGPQISAEMARRGLAVRFVSGRRLTAEHPADPSPQPPNGEALIQLAVGLGLGLVLVPIVLGGLRP